MAGTKTARLLNLIVTICAVTNKVTFAANVSGMISSDQIVWRRSNVKLCGAGRFRWSLKSVLAGARFWAFGVWKQASCEARRVKEEEGNVSGMCALFRRQRILNPEK